MGPEQSRHRTTGSVGIKQEERVERAVQDNIEQGQGGSSGSRKRRWHSMMCASPRREPLPLRRRCWPFQAPPCTPWRAPCAGGGDASPWLGRLTPCSLQPRVRDQTRLFLAAANAKEPRSQLLHERGTAAKGGSGSRHEEKRTRWARRRMKVLGFECGSRLSPSPTSAVPSSRD